MAANYGEAAAIDAAIIAGSRSSQILMPSSCVAAAKSGTRGG